MSSFLNALLSGKTIKATASRKLDNETRTVTLRALPADMSENAFVETATKSGIDGSVKVKTDDNRTRSVSAKEVYGEPATVAVCDVLGVALPQAKPTDPAPTTVRNRRTASAPSVNGTAPTDGADIG